jgi:hypothetical protein
MKLLKLLKVFRKTKKDYQAPGMDWDADEQKEDVEKESAVSKKLSEMTTRRVVGLVLTIMLILPFF